MANVSLNCDLLVNPGPGIAPVFRITSTIINLAEGVEHDRNRIRRLAYRLQTLALVLNTLAHAGKEAGEASSKPNLNEANNQSPSVNAKRLTKRNSSYFESAKALIGGLQTVPMSVSPVDRPSIVTSHSDLRESPPSSPTPSTSERPMSRAWRTMSRLSMLALSPIVTSPTTPTVAVPGTITLSPTAKRPPAHLNIDSLLLLLERIKGFIKNTCTNDLLRIMGTRRRFEDRLRTYQGLVRTWVEEVGDGIENPETYDLDNVLDIVADIENLKQILGTHISKLTGDREYTHYNKSNINREHSSTSQNWSDDESTDEDGDFNLLRELHIDPGLFSAASEFAQRRFAELVAISKESTELAAVFQNANESTDDSSHYSIDIALEIKWLGLVVKALSGAEPLDLSSISPYDLDEEGDGAPLGPVGISESLRGSLFTRCNSSLDCRDVVIKRFIPSKHRDLRRLFCEKSATWLSASSDPRILPILGTCYQTIPQLLITPYMRNGNISSYSRLHPGHSLRLLFETASTMSLLHGLGILHGALRSSNVLVDDAGKAVLTDFGLWDYRVEVAADGIARNGWRRWTAPELLRGGTMRMQSDVYSFAMTMYEILTGNIPFHNTLNDPDDPESGFDPDTEESEISRLVLYDSIRPPRPSHCPDKFWSLIESCWAQDPFQRPSFGSIESQLQVLLKLQSSFRRQSQIKSRQEAFLVEVPLDDLLSSVLAVSSPRNVTSPVEPSPLRRSNGVNGDDEESSFLTRQTDSITSVRSSDDHKISVNLSFNLDNNIFLSTIPTLPLGIDLPKKEATSDTDSEDGDDLLPIDSIETWSSEYDESIFAFWDVLVSSNNDVDPTHPIPWTAFTASLKAQYPTIITSLPSLKSAFQDPPSLKSSQPPAASFSTFRKYITSQIPESAMSDTDSFAPLEQIFGQFCICKDLANPQSKGPISPTRVHEAIANITGNSVAINIHEHYLHTLVTLPNSSGVDILETLCDERIILTPGIPSLSFKSLLNSTYDSRGFLPLHAASKISTNNSKVVQLLLENGADPLITCKKGGWTALHIASWTGASTTVSTILEFEREYDDSEEEMLGGLVGVKDEEGWTCLMHASRYGHLETVKIITGVLQDKGIVDRDEIKECILLAEKYGWSEVKNHLETLLLGPPPKLILPTIIAKSPAALIIANKTLTLTRLPGGIYDQDHYPPVRRLKRGGEVLNQAMKKAMTIKEKPWRNFMSTNLKPNLAESPKLPKKKRGRSRITVPVDNPEFEMELEEEVEAINRWSILKDFLMLLVTNTMKHLNQITFVDWIPDSLESEETLPTDAEQDGLINPEDNIRERQESTYDSEDQTVEEEVESGYVQQKGNAEFKANDTGKMSHNLSEDEEPVLDSLEEVMGEIEEYSTGKMPPEVATANDAADTIELDKTQNNQITREDNNQSTVIPKTTISRLPVIPELSERERSETPSLETQESMAIGEKESRAKKECTEFFN
ncbi:UNVERIFIED_CONTAM: hypothetical protein HDU68_010614 [Siphonaria sp. JEL0065]|nr:hypothetical protein HDU68_010614 [Siphonaria sp. JEL0065]